MKIEMEINSNKINIYCEGKWTVTSLCKIKLNTNVKVKLKSKKEILIK
jgi:hypothetical protein